MSRPRRIAKSMARKSLSVAKVLLRPAWIMGLRLNTRWLTNTQSSDLLKLQMTNYQLAHRNLALTEREKLISDRKKLNQRILDRGKKLDAAIAKRANLQTRRSKKKEITKKEKKK